jgi:IclR family pca regulon transcriptional regulator
MSFDDLDGDEYIQSLARGLSVIRAFGAANQRLTMAQVAAACDLTRAGARRILLTLQNLGYVTMDGRHFSLTSKILELSQGYLAQSLWQKAEPILETVVEDLNETASAAVLEGFDVVYTLRVRCSRMLQFELQPGAHLPAHASSVGRVLLAGLPTYELERYLRQAEFRKYTPATVADPQVLCDCLQTVRSQGWCHLHGEMDEAVSGVAVPLRDAAGQTVAAISIGTNSARATPAFVRSRVVPTLQAAASRIMEQ